jgi:hypothetical protein
MYRLLVVTTIYGLWKRKARGAVENWARRE